jgi:hypothetical protein
MPQTMYDIVPALSRTIGVTIDGSGAEVSTGVKGYIQAPFSGTISRWTLFADTTGDIVFDIWRDTFANYPPTAASSITGSGKPTLINALSAESTDLTTWNPLIFAGDIVAFSVDSVSGISRVTLELWITTIE